jgi:hypothetical protein
MLIDRLQLAGSLYRGHCSTATEEIHVPVPAIALDLKTHMSLRVQSRPMQETFCVS